MFEIITVAIVLAVIVLLGIGAYKAEKVLNARAKEARENQTIKASSKATKPSKASKKK